MGHHPHTHTHAHTQLTEHFLALRRNTVEPRLSFTHRACYRVIELLINVSVSQDNRQVLTICFSRLAMRDIQCHNLLCVHYAFLRFPRGGIVSREKSSHSLINRRLLCKSTSYEFIEELTQFSDVSALEKVGVGGEQGTMENLDPEERKRKQTSL